MHVLKCLLLARTSRLVEVAFGTASWELPLAAAVSDGFHHLFKTKLAESSSLCGVRPNRKKERNKKSRKDQTNVF